MPNAESTISFGMLLGKILINQVGFSNPLRHIFLYGGLGMGKTTLVHGLVRAYPGGDMAEVCSPSFTLCNIYPTNPKILHVDLYRLDDGFGYASVLPEEVWEFIEYHPSGIMITEWAQRLREVDKPKERLDILLTTRQEQHTATISPYGLAAVATTKELAKNQRLKG